MKQKCMKKKFLKGKLKLNKKQVRNSKIKLQSHE